MNVGHRLTFSVKRLVSVNLIVMLVYYKECIRIYYCATIKSESIQSNLPQHSASNNIYNHFQTIIIYDNVIPI